MERHDFSVSNKRLLAERVGFHCSNPSCGVSTIGPSINSNDKEYVGVAAHIYSASINNGPRANPDLTKDERSSIDNGIHLCNKCSTIIDKNDGAGYPAEILFGWKLAAEANAKARIYSDNSYALFTEIKFSNLERRYSTALTCAGLNDKNVASCPANKIVITNILNKLTLAYKCVINGVSGSGKSLVTYQAAYELHKNNWSVFNVDKRRVSDGTNIAAPKEKSIIIVDDAQTLEIRYLERILNASHENCLVLVNWNSSISLDDSFLRSFPCVEIAPLSQVELLRVYCVKNKSNISRLLESIGISTDSRNYHSRIEARIERAAQEKTPWLFNYHLTEGWNSAQQDLSVLKSDDELSLVLVVVAIYQFATLDKGVGEGVVISTLRRFRDNAEWVRKVYRTISKYCDSRDGVVKNKHYEYSRNVLKIFASQRDSKEEFLFLKGVIKRILKSPAYLSGHANVLEFLIFNFRWCEYELNRDGFAEELVIEMLSKEDRLELSSDKVAKLNSIIRFNKSTLNLLNNNNDVLEYWVLNCCRETAHAIGNLCNTLHNEKYQKFTSSKPLVRKIIVDIVSSDIEDKSRFAYLLNRLYLLLSNEDRVFASNELMSSGLIVRVSSYSDSTACYQFSRLIYNLSCINSDWANQQVKDNVSGIAALLNNNIMESYRNFKDLIDSYFGIIGAILGIKNSNLEMTRRGRELSGGIQVDSILEGFEFVEVVDVQDFSNILIFFALYNKVKLKEISERFNYRRLGELYEGDAKNEHHHRVLISVLYSPNSVNYMNYISKVIVNSNYIDALYVALSPELSLNRLQEGVCYKIKLHDCSECEKELLILQGVMSESGGESLAKRMLIENESEISKAIFGESINTMTKKGNSTSLCLSTVSFLKCMLAYLVMWKKIKNYLQK